MTAPPTILWFHQDLRLADHAALTWAAARGPVLPLYIYDDEMPAALAPGGASKWWLHDALENFSRDLAAHNLNLIIRRGKPLEVLSDVIRESGAKAVTWTRRYEHPLATRDAEIAETLKHDGIDIAIHSGFLLFEPEAIKTQSGTLFKVFTPFSKACFAAPAPGPVLPVPKQMQGVEGIASDSIDSLKLVPAKSEWPKQLRTAWQVSEQAAHDRLHHFIAELLPTYKTARDQPATDGTSRLSPYLHFGHISPRQVWHAIHHARAHAPQTAASAERYLLELLWREFSWHLLHHIPSLVSQPLQKSFTDFPWRQDDKGLQAWQRGQTGYPIIDAGMRQLWQTGWMHNRVRMIVASFLIKDLLIDWRTGASWFWDTLVDADLGANTASWQWVAGCGADAAPYFRVFNPTLQGQKFDPKGGYVREFVPELAKLDVPYIHEPWKAPADMLAKAGIKLGQTYPLPILDHAKARLRALSALKSVKNGDAPAPESTDLVD
jgi:deoxyribodipyrimidine photo-lyase